MLKPILILIVIGLIFLGIVSYFIFGLNQKSLPEKAHAPTAHAPTAQAPKDLKIEDTKVGTGPAVKSGDSVKINYTGTLQDGTKFDSSYDRGQPFETQIGVGQVIKGWDQGVVGMKVGGKRKLIIPPSLGYGEQAVGSIPPNSTLLFDVELVQIK